MRYAIYFAADADDQLSQLGNSWLGRDPFTGRELEMPTIAGLSRQRFSELTSSPRRYGFHGTLKAPFSLGQEESEAALLAACNEFAMALKPFELQCLDVNRLDKFLALTPTQEEPELRAFAGMCVRYFDGFRAPLVDADLQRRRKSGLTPVQDAHLVDWGYPYVFDEFRFHMTLSIRLENEAEADLMASAAKAHFSNVTGRPRQCRHFALYEEPEQGAPFQIKKLFELTGDLTPTQAQNHADRPTRKENA
jgi:putative phosphonate metabolism protein